MNVIFYFFRFFLQDLIGDYNCSCPEGFGGRQCYPVCVPGACKNGGACIHGLRGYTCLCLEGFTGDSCEHVVPTDPPTTTGTTRRSKTNATVDDYNTTTTNPVVNTTLGKYLKHHLRLSSSLKGCTAAKPHLNRRGDARNDSN